jgi:hypothetical protein
MFSNELVSSPATTLPSVSGMLEAAPDIGTENELTCVQSPLAIVHDIRRHTYDEPAQV